MLSLPLSLTHTHTFIHIRTQSPFLSYNIVMSFFHSSFSLSMSYTNKLRHTHAHIKLLLFFVQHHLSFLCLSFSFQPHFLSSGISHYHSSFICYLFVKPADISYSDVRLYLVLILCLFSILFFYMFLTFNI